ncbi:MAG: hypothetical protein Q7T63_19510 [Burkholderiaceae bacterium]|nr:hypothetical protein [Burkholderiaceae bacterium]MDO9088578.1 hypothetical protein [Burkholderiaceae bacterium]
MQKLGIKAGGTKSKQKLRQNRASMAVLRPAVLRQPLIYFTSTRRFEPDCGRRNLRIPKFS